MTWAKIDDGFLDHPKVLRAGEDAANLHLRAIIWCGKHLTDGEMPREALGAITRRRDAAKLAALCVKAGLWEETPEGWTLHGFAEHNPTRAEVEERRRKTTAKVAAWRERKAAQSGKPLVSEGCNPVTNPVVTHAVTDPVTLPPARPGPARPDREREPPYPPQRGGRVEAKVEGAPAPEAGEAGEVPAVRLATVEHTGPRLRSDEVLFALRNEGRARLTTTSAHAVELDRVLSDLAARAQGWTMEGVTRMARHVRDAHQGEGRDGRAWRPTLDYLRGRDGSWTGLATLYDKAQACEACGPVVGAPAPVIPLRPEALRPLLDAFLAGAAGAIPAVPREGAVAADAEKVLAAAGMDPAGARALGAFAAIPARWSRSPRVQSLGRAPTVHDLLAYGGEAWSECIAQHRAASRRAAAAPPAPSTGVRTVTLAEVLEHRRTAAAKAGGGGGAS